MRTGQTAQTSGQRPRALPKPAEDLPDRWSFIFQLARLFQRGSCWGNRDIFNPLIAIRLRLRQPSTDLARL